jgi:EAL domain-containing protein (putative c-di-GMP-specific phosphodiesterase class I)
MTASVGISVYPDHGKDVETLMKNADTAVHQAKSAGRKAYAVYSRSMSAGAINRLEIESEIRDALDRDLFQLYYQPKFCADSLRIVGAEALLRWFHPTRGEISPGVFIPIAEEAGLICDVGHWVASAACRQIRTWHDANLETVPISINLSGEEFHTGDPVKMIREAASAERVLPERLQIELTESVIMRDVDAVRESLDGLKRLGCRLLIDDFGTGYSSLAYLKRFPLDTLKIDRSFVRDIATNPDDDAICSAIVAMARRLGLSVVAEGVETEDQVRRLRAHGCDLLQGFLLGKPMPADLFMQVLSAQRTGSDTPDTTQTGGSDPVAKNVVGLRRP